MIEREIAMDLRGALNQKQTEWREFCIIFQLISREKKKKHIEYA